MARNRRRLNAQVRVCLGVRMLARAWMRVHSVLSSGVSLHARFIVRSCPPGHLLVNSTIDSQICLECGPGTYTVNMFQGCEEEMCNRRPCTKCPVGVDCAKGLNPSWMHFVPKLLKIGGTLLVAHSLCFLHIITLVRCDPLEFLLRLLMCFEPSLHTLSRSTYHTICND